MWSFLCIDNIRLNKDLHDYKNHLFAIKLISEI